MTRTQFLASICAIPFIGKLFKPRKRWMHIVIPYYGDTDVLGYPDIKVSDQYVPFGTLTEKPEKWICAKPSQTQQPHITGGKLMRSRF